MDMLCSVCSEPWDAYGARHGDMLPWEYNLFRKGAGCPGCEGNGPDDPAEREANLVAAMRRQIMDPTDDDPVGNNLMAIAEGAKRPMWERPDDPILWECDGCGIRVIRDMDTGDLEYEEHGPCKQWYHSHPLSRRDDPPEQPSAILTGGFRVCEYCHTSCHDCGMVISGMVESDHSNYAFLKSDDHTGREARCYGCEEQTCPNCDNSPDDCVCCELCHSPEWSCDCVDCDTCGTHTLLHDTTETDPGWHYCQGCGVPETETAGGAV